MTKALTRGERDTLLACNTPITGARALEVIDALTALVAEQAADRAALAAATALIREALEAHEEDPDGNIGTVTADKLRAFLAGQPAAPARTAAEQAVLDAARRLVGTWSDAIDPAYWVAEQAALWYAVKGLDRG